MPKAQTVCGNGNTNLRLPFVFVVVIAWMLVAVTHSAPQKEPDVVTGIEYLMLERVPYSDEEQQLQPLTKLEVDVQSSTAVLLTWGPLVNETEEGEIKYQIVLQQLGDNSGEESIQNFTSEKNRFMLRNLEPGRSYQVQVFLGDGYDESLEANFTTKPNCPDRFVVWYRNETSLMIYWQPPSGVFDMYKAEISPRDGKESTLLVSKENYQTGELTPGFYDLTPGRAYNISVMTLSRDMESKPLIKEYRTVPLKPENVTVTLSELKNRPTTSITVSWLPPSTDQGDYDGFNVYINHRDSKPIQKFVPKTKPPRTHLEDPSLEVGQTYEVIVKTVSGKVSSAPVSHNFIFLPKPLN